MGPSFICGHDKLAIKMESLGHSALTDIKGIYFLFWSKFCRYMCAPVLEEIIGDPIIQVILSAPSGFNFQVTWMLIAYTCMVSF